MGFCYLLTSKEHKVLGVKVKWLKKDRDRLEKRSPNNLKP